MAARGEKLEKSQLRAYTNYNVLYNTCIAASYWLVDYEKQEEKTRVNKQ